MAVGRNYETKLCPAITFWYGRYVPLTHVHRALEYRHHERSPDAGRRFLGVPSVWQLSFVSDLA